MLAGKPSLTRAQFVVSVALTGLLLAGTTTWAQPTTTPLEGLQGPTSAVYDQHGVPTVLAENEHDALFLQGYLHARDRLFQMDFQRRLFSGTLAEMFGPAVLPQDVQLRTLGLRRAAERSLPVQTPEVLAWLSAYTEGVNAFLQDESQPLPPEYGALELTRDGIPPWTELDSLTVAKGLAFGLSFDLEDIDRTLAYLNFDGVGQVAGFFGLGLYLADLYRQAPFDPTISIHDAAAAANSAENPLESGEIPSYLNEGTINLLQGYRDQVADIPLLRHALDSSDNENGSNWWIASGAITESGFAMIANDPHLSLDTPATFYEVHLMVPGSLNVTGTSFPGAPGVVLGCNDTACWGAAVNPMDVTDVYQEVLVAVPTPGLPPGTLTHSVFEGNLEPLQIIPQTFLFNVMGDGVPDNLADAGVGPESGGVTLVVPRRNFGPIVNIDASNPAQITALSVAYTGWGPTQELEAFRRFSKAQNVADFREGLQYFDFGSQNFGYADINGNIAYFTSGELPIREDLQILQGADGFVLPFWIRDGTHTLRHEWLPVQHPQPHQSLNREILPFDEMPQVVNPSTGYVLIANNDPIGTTLDNISYNQLRPGGGVLYLSPGYAPGYRIGRLQRLFDAALAGGARLTMDQFRDFQANNQLLDAEVLTPFLLQAFDNATAEGAPEPLAQLAADPGITEAVERLAGWDFSTPTGIAEGYDPGDDPTAPGPPTMAEADASVAATIYAAWRGQVLQRVIRGTLAPYGLEPYAPGSAQAMSALRNLLDTFPARRGVGASGLNFFIVPGISDKFVARDVILLQSLRAALDLLASDEFAPAFGNSTDQDDYRWGKLHRIVFAHPLDDIFSIPPNPFTGLPDLGPDLPGLSRAGGMGSVDAASHDAFADGLNEFMFTGGPARRFVATMTPEGPQAIEVIPGGESGVLGSPFQSDQLRMWLVNDYHPLPVSEADVLALAVREEVFRGVVCNSATAMSDPQTCTAEVACDAIASCVGGDGVTPVCEPGGAYPAGTTSVSVTCGTATALCDVSVADVTPPSISVALSPDELWPPNHRMEPIQAQVTGSDSCGGAVTVVLESVGSSEPDNATGYGDGDTINDIQEADLGSADFDFDLRAERAGTGPGRVYTVTYSATDGSGNQATADATVVVPHDRGGITEPLLLTLEQNGGGTIATWDPVEGAQYYNVVRGNLRGVRNRNETYLMAVTCIEAGSLDESTVGHEDAEIPPPGEVFVYMAEFNDGTRSSYGTLSAAKPRAVIGDCE